MNYFCNFLKNKKRGKVSVFNTLNKILLIRVKNQLLHFFTGVYYNKLNRFVRDASNKLD